MTGARRALAGAALAAGGFALAFAAGLTAPFNEVDEPWFLEVVRRVNAGAALYRDVSFGATPLAVQVTSLLTRLFGLEALVLRALLAACFVATAYLAVRIVRRDRGKGGGLLVAALFLFARVGGHPSYSPLATLFLVGAFAAATSRDPRVSTSLAGVCAGLAFAAKQNVGLYALAAALVSAAAEGPRAERVRRAARTAAGFAVAAALPLLPVARTGGLPGLVDFGFLGKGAYLELGKVSYASGFAPLLRYLARPSAAWWAVGLALESSAFFLPLLATAALVIAWLAAPRDRRAAVLRAAAFASAGILGIYPRADTPHLAYTAPAFLTGLAFAWHELEPRLRPAVRRALVAAGAAWVAASLGMRHVPVLRQWRDGVRCVSRLPHFRGVLTTRAAETRIRANANEIAAWAATPPGAPPVFLLGARAGLYYLVTGLENPTRYDFPWVTTFGREGEGELEELVESGAVRVLVLSEPRSRMSPAVLERLAAERLLPQAAGSAGVLYGP